MRRVRRHAARVAVAAGLAAAGLGLAACGVPSSHNAISLPGNDRVSAGSTTSSSSTTTTQPKTVHQTTVYFFRSDGLLTGVQRAFPSKVTPSDVLFLLGEGPYNNATEKNLKSAVPTIASPRITVTDGIARVILDGSTFDALYATQLSNALGQIVVTLMTNFPAIKGVNFFLHEPGLALVPYNYTPFGTAVRRPVTVQTYASLLPAKSTPGTGTTKR